MRINIRENIPTEIDLEISNLYNSAMNRLVVIFILLLLPLQAAWAGVTAYCAHESDVASQHFGHHYHKHHVSPSDQSGDPSRGSSGLDKDCGICHLNLNLAHSNVSMLLLDVGPQLDGFPLRHRYSLFVPRGPERPNWRVFA